MYGIYTHIQLIFIVNVGKHTIRGCYGILITCPPKNDGWTRKGWTRKGRFVVVEINTLSFASNSCVWLLFSRVYMYIYIYTVYIGSPTHSLTIAPEGLQKEIPYSKYIMIYVYIYNCHPAVLTICMYTP